MPTYKATATVWSKPGVGTPVVTCQSCGAVVNQLVVLEKDGVKTTGVELHEKFHTGLAQLWAAQVS